MVLYRTAVLRHNFQCSFGAGADCMGPYKLYRRGTFFKTVFGTVFEKDIVRGE
jgi:hypothetical protein